MKKVVEEKTDEELMIEFCSSMNEDIFHALMVRYHGKALAFVQRSVFNRHRAEDIVQDSFLKVVRNKDHFDPAMKFGAWFYSILRNTIIDSVRQYKRHQSKLDKISANIDLFARQNEGYDDELNTLLTNVSDNDRSLLVDHFIYGMTFVELAEKLGLSKEALKKRAQRALKKIRASFSCSNN